MARDLLLLDVTMASIFLFFQVEGYLNSLDAPLLFGLSINLELIKVIKKF